MAHPAITADLTAVKEWNKMSGSPGKDGRYLNHLLKVHTSQHLTQNWYVHIYKVYLPDLTYLPLYYAE